MPIVRTLVNKDESLRIVLADLQLESVSLLLTSLLSFATDALAREPPLLEGTLDGALGNLDAAAFQQTRAEFFEGEVRVLLNRAFEVLAEWHEH